MVRGKPREDAILAAAREELLATGYANLTMDAVAARARSSKATIYRRWRNKAQLVKAVLDGLDADDGAAIPVTGALRSDLVAVMRAIRRKASAPYVAMITDLVLASKRDAALAQALGEHVDDESLSPFHEVLARHFSQKQADFQLIHDVAEALVIRQLQRGPLNDAFIRRVVDRVLVPLLEAGRGER
jgi:AcrR family transcriptional regulator